MKSNDELLEMLVVLQKTNDEHYFTRITKQKGYLSLNLEAMNDTSANSHMIVSSNYLHEKFLKCTDI